jgi:transketolase
MALDVKKLSEKAEAIRETVVKMLVAAGSGHTAGPLGMADIFAAFYFHILTHPGRGVPDAAQVRLPAPGPPRAR